MPPLTLTYSTDAMCRLNGGGGVMAVAAGAEKNLLLSAKNVVIQKKRLSLHPKRFK